MWFYRVLAFMYLLVLAGGSVYTIEAAHAYGTKVVTGAALAFFTMMFFFGLALAAFIYDNDTGR